MLNEVSCWYVDWASIGAWVGGIGSAAAAIVALRIAKRDTTKRQRFAEFLFKRDLEKLISLEVLLRQSAEAMADLEIHRGVHPDEYAAKVAQDNGFIALSKISHDMEYFGRSEMLFEYNPETSEFLALQSAIRGVEGIPDIVNISLSRFDGVVASDEMLTTINKLSEALRPFAIDGRPSGQYPSHQ